MINPSYTGGIRDGLPDGYGVYACNDYQYVGHWAAGAPHGKGTRQTAEGVMEHGHFERGVLAIGIRSWPNRDFEDGRFIDGVLAAGRRQRNMVLEEGEFMCHPLLD